MNLLQIATKFIRQRRLASSLTGLSVALGVMLMVTVLVIHGMFDRMFRQSATGYDLIVGRQGSRLQLVLNTLYRVTQPIENLPYRYYRELKDDRRIETAIPLALGDTTEQGGFPIVGTIPEFFTTEYMPGKNFRGKQGAPMNKPFDAIIGARVANELGWDVGSKLQLVHGGMDDHVHDEKFTVVDVLAPTYTPNDKSVFVNLEGFYLIAGHETPLEEAIQREREFFGEAVEGDEPNETAAPEEDEEDGHDHAHGHSHDIPEAQKEVTAILVRTKVATMNPILMGEINSGLKAQAVAPISEITWLNKNVVGNVKTIIVILTGMIVVVSGLSIFVSIYNSMAERRRDIAILRALGARRSTVLSVIITESVLLCVGGGILGMVLGHGIAFAAAPWVERSGFMLEPFAFDIWELALLPGLAALAVLVGLVPGWTAYNTDVAQSLADN